MPFGEYKNYLKTALGCGLTDSFLPTTDLERKNQDKIEYVGNQKLKCLRSMLKAV